MRMNLPASVGITAALMLSGLVYAQTGIAPETTMEERMLGVTAGTHVQSPAGETIGTVEDVVPSERTGRPDYVLIATASGAETAVPYDAIMPRVHDGRIILDRSRLEGAPAVSASEVRDGSHSAWKTQVDQYWNRR